MRLLEEFHALNLLWVFSLHCVLLPAILEKMASCGVSFLNINTWLKTMTGITRSPPNRMKSYPWGNCFQRLAQILGGYH